MDRPDRCRALDEGLRDPHRPKELGALRALGEWLAGLTDVKDCIAIGLRRCSEGEDWLGFELYVLAALHHPSRAYTEILCWVLARRDIDVSHENIVDVLAEIRNPASVECLRDALWWEPEWDEFRNLAVKCIWALAAIGTPDAVAAIREVADSESIKVRRAAEYELQRFEGRA